MNPGDYLCTGTFCLVVLLWAVTQATVQIRKEWKK